LISLALEKLLELLFSYSFSRQLSSWIDWGVSRIFRIVFF
jgi:hypothetical protein